MKGVLTLPVHIIIRISKALLTLATGIYAIIVVFGNLTDYGTNYNFIRHVMSMDTTYPDNTTMYRAIKSSKAVHLVYIFVIAMESLIAILCTKGGLDMLRYARSDPETFHEAKRSGIAGLTVGLLLWFLTFQGIAGEWFGMWMSKSWNGLPDAARLTQYISTILVYVSLKNDGDAD
ncbi:MAG: DUF2165 domain-containing protein [Candidatus Promineifilaceae bacterium]|nr:DUF2165 domain-containing protein [Candidatus Promineifilaceae bacterium]